MDHELVLRLGYLGKFYIVLAFPFPCITPSRRIRRANVRSRRITGWNTRLTTAHKRHSVSQASPVVETLKRHMASCVWYGFNAWSALRGCLSGLF
jgi:hypothetical protein